MNVNLQKIKVRDLVDGYQDSETSGAIGYHGNLNIRPAYQREFIYSSQQQQSVIQTVLKGFPLNILYWVKNPDGSFECLDGQQRMLSICHFVNGDFHILVDDKPMYYNNLEAEEQDQILDYELMVYICEGTNREKLDWFEVVNYAGEQLTGQELRNAIYTGPWVADAKRHFSKAGAPAVGLFGDYMNGKLDRQEILETALKWASVSGQKQVTVDEYMAEHQNDKDADELWQYFKSVADWTMTLFPNYRKIMKGLPWGLYYNCYHNNHYNSNNLEAKISELLQDEDVTNQKGVYEYVLSNCTKEEKLSIRAFTEKEKLRKYEEQGGVCPRCHGTFEYRDMAGDHIVPWSAGGHTVVSNLQMLCRRCNGIKSDN